MIHRRLRVFIHAYQTNITALNRVYDNELEALKEVTPSRSVEV